MDKDIIDLTGDEPQQCTKRASKNRRNDSNKKPHSVPAVHSKFSKEVPLKFCENPWKPVRFDTSWNCLSDDEKRTRELYRAVTEILNKLTPTNFQKLVSKFKKLNIDTESRMQGVIGLIFEKACDEPKYCRLYVEFCEEAQHVRVETTDLKDGKGSFRHALFKKCLEEFDWKMFRLDSRENSKENELNNQSDEEDIKERRKFVGNCRLIGELYRSHLTSSMMVWDIIKNLISLVCETSLQGLHVLLYAAGKYLNQSNDDLDCMDEVFEKIKTLAIEVHPKVPTRIRFMLLDTIDLRKANWVPRILREEKPQMIVQEGDKDGKNNRHIKMHPPSVSDDRKGQKNERAHDEKSIKNEEKLKNEYCRVVIKDSVIKLSKEDAYEIEMEVIRELGKLPKSGFTPKFSGINIEDGSVVINCWSPADSKWFVKLVPLLEPWKDAELVVEGDENVRKKVGSEPGFNKKIELLIPGIKEPPGCVLERIRRQNTGLDTSKWKVEFRYETVKGTRLLLCVDEKAVEEIRRRKQKLYVGMQQVHVKILKGSWRQKML